MKLTAQRGGDALHVVDRTAVALLKGSYQVGMWRATLAVATDVADEGHGTVADLTLSARSQLAPRISVEYGVAAQWINDKQACTHVLRRYARAGRAIGLAAACYQLAFE